MKRVLFILSEFGYWGEELVGPLETLEKAGYLVDFATPNGETPHALPPSMDPEYIDPPLGKTVVSKSMAKKVREIENGKILSNPMSIASLINERPYMSNPQYLREFEEYNNSIDDATERLKKYDALVIVGGSGPIVDLVNNHRVHAIILSFYKQNKPIAAECYGVACLAFARDYWSRKSIIDGKHVTGHPLEYDYLDGTGFYGVDFNMGPPPYPLEFILRDAVGKDGQFIGNVGKEISAIVDFPFITGRSTADSYRTGELLVEVLENNLRKYGW